MSDNLLHPLVHGKKFTIEAGAKQESKENDNGQFRTISSKPIQSHIPLNGADAGIQIAKQLADAFNIPCIILKTACLNQSSAEASVNIPKNLHRESTDIVIDALTEALQNKILPPEFNQKNTKTSLSKMESSIFLKDGDTYIKVLFEQIDYMKSDGNYVEIYWEGKKSTLKKTLKSVMDRLPKNDFIQVHRSYIVNINKLELIGYSHLQINNHKIPLSKSKREGLLACLLYTSDAADD